MTQKPPRIFTRFVIYGDTKPADGQPVGWPETTPYDITDSLGVDPTKESHEGHILIWEYALPEQSSWELPELLSDMMKKFDPEKVIQILAEYKLQAEVAAKKEVMGLEFQYNMQLKGVEVDGQKQKESQKEDRKDERTKLQASQQSELIEQRQKQTGPKNFESGGNDILGGGFGLGTFDPK